MSDDRALIAFAEEYLAECGGARAGVCYPLSWNVRDIFGIELVEGEFNGIPHTWNVMPDGRIFDGSHGQFDDGPPRFFPAGAFG